MLGVVFLFPHFLAIEIIILYKHFSYPIEEIDFLNHL